MQELIELLSGASERLELDRAALQLASIEYPGLESAPFLHLLDSYAVELAGRLENGGEGPEYLQTANQYLFEELGFHGNARDYYDPKNSCLNDVLTARSGIPITLSIVYMEIARRLAKPVFGIGLPGHFLVEYNDGQHQAYLDPFHGGRTLAAEECYALARQVTGTDFSSDPVVLRPATKRQMLIRMLNNLRAVYFTRGADRKALAVMDLLVAALPESPEEFRQRAAVHVRLKQLAAARADLERYLALAPNSPDCQEVERQLQALRHWLAGMN